MEKNRIRPIKSGKSSRMSYSRQKEVLQMPNLIEVQKDSYQWFLDEGLKEVFDDISPISDYSGHLSLEFVDFTLCEKDVKYTIEECKERDATYAAPLKVRVRLHNKETDEINEHEIFMGDLPLMTATGTFVIMVQSVLSSVSSCVRPVFIMPLRMISLVKDCFPLPSFQTVEHGWNMRQIPMTFSMCVLTGQEKYRLQY